MGGVVLMRVFVSGVAGFLGSALAQRCLERGWEVTGIDNLAGGDEANVPPGVAWAPAACQDGRSYRHLIDGADVVYHCAAAPYEGLSVFSPQVVYENVVMATVALAREAIAAGAGRFVNCSSMSRYGAQQAPFTEDMPAAPVSPYGCAKAAAEEAVRNLCSLHGLDWVTVIPHSVYGPGQRYDDPFRNVSAIMINRVLQGRPPVIYGDGTQLRSFSYVDDVTGPMLEAALRPVAGETINVGPDDPGTPVIDLARMILKLCESGLEPEYFPARPAEVHTATCSAGKARALLGYEPAWALEDGLQRQVEWIRARGPRPFDYRLPVELPGPAAPRTWTERLI
jgi:UDP-glucose 4-epimerase